MSVSQTDVLLGGPGEVQSVQAQVEDANRNVVVGDVTWRSEDPEVATVSGDGTITAVDFGSTTLVVEADDAVPQRIHIAVAEAAADVKILPASDLLETPEVLSLPGDGSPLGTVFSARFSNGIPAPSVGERMILSDWQYWGRVSAVQSEPDAIIVEFEVEPLDGAFETLRLDYQVPLAEALDRRPGEDITKAFDLAGAGFSCSTESDQTVDLSTDIDPRIEQDMELKYQVEIDNFATEFASLYLEGDLRVYMDGVIGIAGTVTEKLTCKLQVLQPFLQAGPVQLQFPFGMGFTFKPEISTSVQTRLAGYIDVEGRYGMQFSPVGGLDSLTNTTVDTQNLSVAFTLPDLDDQIEASQVKGALDVFAFIESKAALGGSILNYLTDLADLFSQETGSGFGVRKLDELQVGARLILDVSGVNKQVSEPGYQPKVGVDVFAKHLVPDPFVALAGVTAGGFYLALNVAEAEIELFNWITDASIPTLTSLSNWNFSTPVASLPTGILTTSSLYPEVGETVRLALDLNNLSTLSAYDPVKIEIYRLVGEGLATTAELWESAVPSPGQTHFEWTWTPETADADEDLVRFLPFVKLRGLDALPLKLDQTPTGMEVAGIDPFESIEVSARASAEADAEVRLCEDGPGCDGESFQQNRDSQTSERWAAAGAGAGAASAGNYRYRRGEEVVNLVASASASGSGFGMANATLGAPGVLRISGMAVARSSSVSVTQCDDRECSEAFASGDGGASASVRVDLADASPAMMVEVIVSSDQPLTSPPICSGQYNCSATFPVSSTFEFGIGADSGRDQCAESQKVNEPGIDTRSCTRGNFVDFTLRFFPAP